MQAVVRTICFQWPLNMGCLSWCRILILYLLLSIPKIASVWSNWFAPSLKPQGEHQSPEDAVEAEALLSLGRSVLQCIVTDAHFGISCWYQNLHFLSNLAKWQDDSYQERTPEQVGSFEFCQQGDCSLHGFPKARGHSSLCVLRTIPVRADLDVPVSIGMLEEGLFQPPSVLIHYRWSKDHGLKMVLTKGLLHRGRHRSYVSCCLSWCDLLV